MTPDLFMNSDSGTDVAPFDFVLFGGTGDLSMRKLLPALYFRHCEGQLPAGSRIIATARSNHDRSSFRAVMEEKARIHINDADFQATCWEEFLDMTHYIRIDASQPDDYQALADFVVDQPDRARVFYLSTAPTFFNTICQGIHDVNLITANSRVAVEKPLGRDRESAFEINDQFAKHFSESQIFRIDHYLGKETVQNLLALRFGNVMFEPLWRREMVSDVQITIAEKLGVGTRGGFYDHTGALRDMVQNHLLQLLVIVAMEPPASNLPDAVRDEKIKVLRALRPLRGKEALDNSVIGQYKAGAYKEGAVPGYLEESDIPQDSRTESFVALRAEIQTWRWAGVPFYLRTGKRMEDKVTEIVINFRKVPHTIFDTSDGFSTPNQLVIRLQPEESIKFRIYVKAWGDDMNLHPVHLDMDFNDIFKKRQMIAYERLIMDLVKGNPTLFLRRDEVEAAWSWIDPIRNAWDEAKLKPISYTAGSWGPAASNVLISKEGFKWYEE